MKDLHSWLALLVALAIIIVLGFIKVLISSFPYETAVIGGIVPVTLGYFGKRVWQKHKSFNKLDEGG